MSTIIFLGVFFAVAVYFYRLGREDGFEKGFEEGWIRHRSLMLIAQGEDADNALMWDGEEDG